MTGRDLTTAEAWAALAGVAAIGAAIARGDECDAYHTEGVSVVLKPMRFGFDVFITASRVGSFEVRRHHGASALFALWVAAGELALEIGR